MEEKILTPQEEIQAWLDSEERDYPTGMVLFSKYSRNEAVIHYLQRKNSPGKLAYELGKLANHSRLKTAKEHRTVVFGKKEEPNLPAERLKIDAAGKINKEDLPEVLQALYAQNAEAYKLLRAVHEKMKIAATDEERAVCRKQLAEYDDAIAARWAAIDRWATTGEVPEAAAAKPANGGKLSPQEVNKHRAAVSRKLGELEKGIEDEAKRSNVLKDLNANLAILTADGQTLKPETVERVRVFIPDFGVAVNAGAGA